MEDDLKAIFDSVVEPEPEVPEEPAGPDEDEGDGDAQL
jgi:hypothetical protein